MPSRGSHRDRSIRRRPPSRQPRERILIVCEGRVTERTYFRDLKREARNPRATVEIARETGVPLTVVQEAVRLRAEAAAEARRERDDNLLYDQVWGSSTSTCIPTWIGPCHWLRIMAFSSRSRTHASSCGRCCTSRSSVRTSSANRYAPCSGRHRPVMTKSWTLRGSIQRTRKPSAELESWSRSQTWQGESGRNPTTGALQADGGHPDRLSAQVTHRSPGGSAAAHERRPVPRAFVAAPKRVLAPYRWRAFNGFLETVRRSESDCRREIRIALVRVRARMVLSSNSRLNDERTHGRPRTRPRRGRRRRTRVPLTTEAKGEIITQYQTHEGDSAHRKCRSLS